MTVTDSYATSRHSLQLVATHVLARARKTATGRFGLRVTPGGFGTPEFGDDVRRVRVRDGLLVVESAGSAGASSTAIAIDGATLEELCEAAGVDLAAPFEAGHDTPVLPKAGTPLSVAAQDATLLGEWFGLVAAALDSTLSGIAADCRPTVAQLWPEHFDVAFDTGYGVNPSPARRVNVGGSPGDASNTGPYLYLGPWTGDRPGEPAFWNVGFGAMMTYESVHATGDPLGCAVEFFRSGLALLAAG